MEHTSYTLRRSRRARRLRIAVHRNGSVIVTIPLRMSQSVVKPFIAKKWSWIQRTVERFKRNPIQILPNTRADFLRLRETARALVQEKIERYNALYRFAFNRISIRNQSTRWGSCSRKGNLNFNYRIVQLPDPLAEYIVVHELCHLVEFNHSPIFWNLVAQTVPDYKERRRELRLRRLQ